MKPKLSYLPLDKINVGERFRKFYGMGEFQDLVDDIKKRGVIQPITVDTDFNLLAGGRRFAASQKLGLKEIPCIIMEVKGEIDAREIELVENIYRLDMRWQEKIALTQRIHELNTLKDKNWTKKQTADSMGRSPSRIVEALELGEAMKVIPELAEYSTEHEARKIYKKMQERVLVDNMLKEKGIESSPGDPSINIDESGKTEDESDDGALLRRANNNYSIGDAMEGLESTIRYYQERKQDSAIKLFEIDPPYGINLNDVKKGNDKHTSYNEIPAEQYAEFLKRISLLSYQAAAPNAWCIFWFGPTWFCEVKSALQYGGWVVDDIPGIWVKSDDGDGAGQTNAPEYYLARAYEPFFIARKGQPLIARRGRSNVFNYSPVPAQRKRHPTQRPLGLIRDILTTFSYPRSVICVPFLGSGATLKACYKEEMLGFGWDLSDEYKKAFLASVESDGE